MAWEEGQLEMQKWLRKEVRVARPGEAVGKLGPTRQAADSVLFFLIHEDGGYEVEDAIKLASWELQGYQS